MHEVCREHLDLILTCLTHQCRSKASQTLAGNLYFQEAAAKLKPKPGIPSSFAPAGSPHVPCACALNSAFSLPPARTHRAEGHGGGEQQLPEQREPVRHHQRPARPAAVPPGEQLHGDEVRRAPREGVHRDQPAAVQRGHLTQR